MMELAGEATEEAQCRGCSSPGLSSDLSRKLLPVSQGSARSVGPGGSSARSLPGPQPSTQTPPTPVLRPLVWLSRCRAGVPSSPFIALDAEIEDTPLTGDQPPHSGMWFVTVSFHRYIFVSAARVTFWGRRHHAVSSGVGGMYPFPCTCPTTDGSKARVPLNPAPSPHTTSSSSLPSGQHPNYHAHQGQPLCHGISSQPLALRLFLPGLFSPAHLLNTCASTSWI